MNIKFNVTKTQEQEKITKSCHIKKVHFEENKENSKNYTYVKLLHTSATQEHSLSTFTQEKSEHS